MKVFFPCLNRLNAEISQEGVLAAAPQQPPGTEEAAPPQTPSSTEMRAGTKCAWRCTILSPSGMLLHTVIISSSRGPVMIFCPWSSPPCPLLDVLVTTGFSRTAAVVARALRNATIHYVAHLADEKCEASAAMSPGSNRSSLLMTGGAGV